MVLFGMWYLKDGQWLWFEMEYNINGPHIKVSDFPQEIQDYLDKVWKGEIMKGPDPIIMMKE